MKATSVASTYFTFLSSSNYIHSGSSVLVNRLNLIWNKLFKSHDGGVKKLNINHLYPLIGSYYSLLTQTRLQGPSILDSGLSTGENSSQLKEIKYKFFASWAPCNSILNFCQGSGKAKRKLSVSFFLKHKKAQVLHTDSILTSSLSWYLPAGLKQSPAWSWYTYHV